MLNIETQSIRTRLSFSASALAVAACLWGGGATAGTVQLGPVTDNTVYNLTTSTDSGVELLSGTTAYYVKNNATWSDPYASLKLGVGAASDGSNAGISTTGSCVFSWDCGNAHAPTITVDSGATVVFVGHRVADWYMGNVELQSAMVANGDLVFENPGPVQSWGQPVVAFLGTNKFLGNVHLLDSAWVQMGYNWAAATSVFGPNTNIILDAHSELDINQGTAPLVMGGTLQGSGLVNLSGTLFINGANTAAAPFHGTLNILPGNTAIIGDVAHPGAVLGDPGNPANYTLTLAGAIAGGGNLRGFGTIAGNLVNNASVVRPGYGDDLGSLTVKGNYTQDAVGTLRVQVTPTGASTLHVMGNAAVNGTLNIGITPGAYKTQIYDVLTVDGTLTGDFSSIVTDSVQGAIGAVTKTAHGYSVVTQVVQGASATAPIVVGHLADANRLNDYYLVSALYDQIAQDSPRGKTEIGPNKYVWIEGFGHVSSVSRNDVGYHTDTEGFRAGAEYRSESNATVGVAMSYSTGNLKAKGASTAEIDTWHGAIYGGYDVTYARLDGVLFYDSYGTTTKRDFGADGVAASSPGGYSYGASIQVSHSLMHDLLTPYVRGIYSRQHVGESTETGADLLNLRYLASNHNLFVGDLGFRINPLRSLPESKTKLLVTVALEHDFSPLGERVEGTFPVTNGQNWFTYWRGDSENTLLLGLDVAQQITNALEVSGRFNGRMSKYQTSGELALNVKYKL